MRHRSTDGGGTWTNVGLKGSRAIAHCRASHASHTALTSASSVTSGTERRARARQDHRRRASWRSYSSPRPRHSAASACGYVAAETRSTRCLRGACRFCIVHVRRGGVGWQRCWIKSTDGGATWKKLTDGLPTRTHRTRGVGEGSQVVQRVTKRATREATTYGRRAAARVPGRKTAAERWTRVSPLDPRPFYFSQIRIDPTNDQHVYVLGFMLHASEDGGRPFANTVQGRSLRQPRAGVDLRHPSALAATAALYQSYSAGALWEHLTKFAGGETSASTPT